MTYMARDTSWQSAKTGTPGPPRPPGRSFVRGSVPTRVRGHKGECPHAGDGACPHDKGRLGRTKCYQAHKIL